MRYRNQVQHQENAKRKKFKALSVFHKLDFELLNEKRAGMFLNFLTCKRNFYAEETERKLIFK